MSAPIRAFDPLTAPISGTNLIEASAGTGKTYGIAALFTRLIVLEQKASSAYWSLPSPKPPLPS
ncbi:exodeoxyribonuclease V subunit beta [Neisseria gonorrhoeae]|uniref:Exodeoxyribonuclease V subunit beta n=1 Tax=Neisseria gonorrhoeae TaxID=485 RepID=A0A378VYL8_NEIGO|nr:exodeoxyribonuclease V subunit beta [Neisseria gonorrhoeae]